MDHEDRKERRGPFGIMDDVCHFLKASSGNLFGIDSTSISMGPFYSLYRDMEIDPNVTRIY
jgi:hypothetical protein